MTTAEKLYSVPQVARVLGLDSPAGRKRVHRLIRTGKIVAEDHGTGVRPRWYVTQKSLQEYLGTRRERVQRTVYLN